MVLYCYMVSRWDLEDNNILPVFHETKFTDLDFEEMCQYCYDDVLMNKVHDRFTGELIVTPKDIIDVLCRKFGFSLLNRKVLNYTVESYNVGSRNDGDVNNEF